ncbi:hypothetical protein [Vibrio parahaemolyticus]|uniref:hypothetical protein n=1 Tax=Vibrio parahaemolyticus TaxID=670 RepID=UPI001E3145FE|nr:hypothetical protein [Vibrio parahaemolyticus]MCD2151588.1 hypothetical protein [Vibrio parahaemolyticus]HCJ4668549.1 hypothetical protein [Vibrio parahaemolyticus]
MVEFTTSIFNQTEDEKTLRTVASKREVYAMVNAFIAFKAALRKVNQSTRKYCSNHYLAETDDSGRNQAFCRPGQRLT